MAALTTIFQTLSLAGSFAVVVLLVYLAWRWPSTRLLVIMPALWAAFGVVYYALVLAGLLAPPALLLWGAVHRFMAVVLALGFAMALWGVVRVPFIHDEGRDHDA